MPLVVKAEGLALASKVDELGRQGMSQDEIASLLGMANKWELFKALKDAGYRIAAENRVRVTLIDERLADLLERGDIVPADPEPAAEREEVAA